MKREEQLDQAIAEWRERLAAHEAQRTRASGLVLENESQAVVMLQEAATGVWVATEAIAALEARRTEAQAHDMEVEAGELEGRAAALEEQAAPIAAEVEKTIARIQALGVALTRRGEPQADIDMQSTARALRAEVQRLRSHAQSLRGR